MSAAAFRDFARLSKSAGRAWLGGGKRPRKGGAGARIPASGAPRQTPSPSGPSWGSPCGSAPGRRSSDLEDRLAADLASRGVRAPEREVEFLPPRKFRADFLWLAERLVVEVQGFAAGGRGPHGGIGKMLRDVERGALAAAAGFRVLPVTAREIRNGKAVEWIEAALRWRDA